MYELQIETATEATEAVSEALRAHGCQGTAIVTEGDTATVTGYVNGEEEAGKMETALCEFLGQLPAWGLSPGPGRITVRSVPEEIWEEAWKTGFHPLRVGRRLWVRPSWEPVEAQPGEIVIVIDPGLAFGTGEHETTQLCAEMLEEVIEGGEHVVDVGTGSGILAILAARLGAGRVEAIDCDPQAVEVAWENVNRNGVAEVVQVREGHFLDGAAGIDVLVANLNTALLEQLLPDVPAALAPGAQVIVSGVAQANRPIVRTVLERGGLDVVEDRARGDWCAFRAVASERSGEAVLSQILRLKL